MLFNSTEFLLFFGAFLLLYWLVHGNLHLRNLLIVAASWLFYAWWDWRFLGLLILSSAVDFGVGQALGRESAPAVRRRWLLVSLVFNLGLLGFFKYFGFFLDSFYTLLDQFGFQHPSWTWRVVLPVGISFYTFQSLSYTLDVYWRRLEPAREPVAFLAFVAFFPQLIAGPIERAVYMLPQFQSPREIRAADVSEGVWLILWGLFKKVVVADQLAPFAELGFDHHIRSAPVVLLGGLAFAGQIYGDFSGYSDIARGLARLLGFDLRWNFDRPYVSTSIREFWHRWHISLSTWLRDYLYFPLGGSRRGEARTSINLLITMLLGGLWHGAAWNFVLWGGWHGLALAIHRQWNARSPQRLPKAVAWALTALVVAYGWLLFRAGTTSNLIHLHSALSVWSAPRWTVDLAIGVAAWWTPLVLMEWWQGRRQDLLAPIRTPLAIRVALQGTMLVLVAAYWRPDAVPFIYFQF